MPLTLKRNYPFSYSQHVSPIKRQKKKNPQKTPDGVCVKCVNTTLLY